MRLGRENEKNVDLDAIDVVVKDGLQSFQHPDGQLLFGIFVDRPSEDGMMMAKFPGLPEPIEVLGMVFRPLKRPRAKPTRSKKTKEL